MIIEVKTVEEFEKVIADNEKVLIKVSSPYCVPCKTYDKVLDQLSAEDDETVIVKVSVDDLPEIASELGVMSVPTTVTCKGGQFSLPVMGVLTIDQLKEMLAN